MAGIGKAALFSPHAHTCLQQATESRLIEEGRLSQSPSRCLQPVTESEKQYHAPLPPGTFFSLEQPAAATPASTPTEEIMPPSE